MAQDVGHAVIVLWSAILHAGLAWLVTTPEIALLLYKVLTPPLRRAAERFVFKPALEAEVTRSQIYPRPRLASPDHTMTG